MCVLAGLDRLGLILLGGRLRLFAGCRGILSPGLHGFEQGPGILERPVFLGLELALPPLQVRQEHFGSPGSGLGEVGLLLLDPLQLFRPRLDRTVQFLKCVLRQPGIGTEGTVAHGGQGRVGIARSSLRAREAASSWSRSASSCCWIRSVSRARAAISGAGCLSSAPRFRSPATSFKGCITPARNCWWISSTWRSISAGSIFSSAACSAACLSAPAICSASAAFCSSLAASWPDSRRSAAGSAGACLIAVLTLAWSSINRSRFWRNPSWLRSKFSSCRSAALPSSAIRMTYSWVWRALTLAVAGFHPVAQELARLEVPRGHVKAGGEAAAALGMVEVMDRPADESAVIAPLHRNHEIGQPEVVVGGNRQGNLDRRAQDEVGAGAIEDYLGRLIDDRGRLRFLHRLAGMAQLVLELDAVERVVFQCESARPVVRAGRIHGPGALHVELLAFDVGRRQSAGPVPEAAASRESEAHAADRLATQGNRGGR